MAALWGGVGSKVRDKASQEVHWKDVGLFAAGEPLSFKEGDGLNLLVAELSSEHSTLQLCLRNQACAPGTNALCVQLYFHEIAIPFL